MTDTKLPRPQAVTLACLFVGSSCLIVLLSLFDLLSNWGSLAIQDSVRRILAEPPFDTAGISVAESLVWLRRVLFVVVGVSIAGVVFAVYAAKGHRPSRVYLTVMAGVVGILFIVIGGWVGLLPAVVSIYCAIQLWSPESRQWFDLKNGRQPPVVMAGGSAGSAAAPLWPPRLVERPDAGQQPQVDGGTSVEQPQQVPGTVQTFTVPSSAASVPAGPARPRAVTTAGLVTLIGSGVVAVFTAYFLAVYLVARDTFLKSMDEQPTKSFLARSNVDPEQAGHVALAGALVLLPLAIAGVVAAVAMMQGRTIGRTATLVLAFVTVPVSLLFTIVGVPWAIAAVVVITQLRRNEAREWFVRT